MLIKEILEDINILYIYIAGYVVYKKGCKVLICSPGPIRSSCKIIIRSSLLANKRILGDIIHLMQDKISIKGM